jgi:hypothetical protein
MEPRRIGIGGAVEDEDDDDGDGDGDDAEEEGAIGLVRSEGGVRVTGGKRRAEGGSEEGEEGTLLLLMMLLLLLLLLILLLIALGLTGNASYCETGTEALRFGLL